MTNTLVIANEDVALLETVQHSMESGYFRGVKIGYLEQGIYWYHEAIDRAIGVENIPENLRVRQLMGSHASD